MTRNQLNRAISRIYEHVNAELQKKVTYHRDHDKKPPSERTVSAYSAGYGDGYRRALELVRAEIEGTVA